MMKQNCRWCCASTLTQGSSLSSIGINRLEPLFPPGTNGLIYVVDSNDRDRIEDAREATHRWDTRDTPLGGFRVSTINGGSSKWRDIWKATILLEIHLFLKTEPWLWEQRYWKHVLTWVDLRRIRHFFGLALDLIFSDLTCIMIIVDGTSILRQWKDGLSPSFTFCFAVNLKHRSWTRCWTRFAPWGGGDF